MKLGYTIIYVDDVLQAVDFYQRAFDLKLKFLHASNQYAEMATGETTLAFAAEELAQDHGVIFHPNRVGTPSAGFEIDLVTGDVHTAFKKAIQEGAQQISPPTEKPWGQTVSYVTDNNGVLIAICSPME